LRKNPQRLSPGEPSSRKTRAAEEVGAMADRMPGLLQPALNFRNVVVFPAPATPRKLNT
jgi:hypothetical protein